MNERPAAVIFGGKPASLLGAELKVGDVAPAGALTNLGLAVEAAARQVDSAEDSHREALDQMHEERERFGRARMERRVVERLKEKRQADWSQESARTEQKELDSVAHNRRGTGEKSA